MPRAAAYGKLLAISGISHNEGIATASSTAARKCYACSITRRNLLVEENLSLVACIARRLLVSLPNSFELDDLIAAGNLGLLRAAELYRPRLHGNTPFSAYARARIRGAMLDSVRRGAYLEAGHSHEPVERACSPDYVAEIGLGRQLAALAGAVDALSPRLRSLIESHYGDELGLAACGVGLELGVSRTTQLHRDAKRALRAALMTENGSDKRILPLDALGVMG